MTFDQKTRLLNWVGYGLIALGCIIPYLVML